MYSWQTTNEQTIVIDETFPSITLNSKSLSFSLDQNARILSQRDESLPEASVLAATSVFQPPITSTREILRTSTIRYFKQKHTAFTVLRRVASIVAVVYHGDLWRGQRIVVQSTPLGHLIRFECAIIGAAII